MNYLLFNNSSASTSCPSRTFSNCAIARRIDKWQVTQKGFNDHTKKLHLPAGGTKNSLTVG